jgi:hypothetical protein
MMWTRDMPESFGPEPIGWTGAHWREDFRCDYYVAASFAEGLAEHCFGGAVAVAVGGVEECHAGVQRGGDDTIGFGGIAAVTQRHRAEADF